MKIVIKYNNVFYLLFTTFLNLGIYGDSDKVVFALNTLLSI